MRLFKFDGTVINFDNDADAETFHAANPDVEELTADEITNIFGNYPHLAGSHTTTVDGGNITFTVPDEYSDLETWLDRFIRPDRDAALLSTDKYLVADYPIKAPALEEIKTYRQTLRDFPATFSEIIPLETVPWPTEPDTI